MYLRIASVRTKLFSRSQSKTEKLLQRVLVRKNDPIFPRIHCETAADAAEFLGQPDESPSGPRM